MFIFLAVYFSFNYFCCFSCCLEGTGFSFDLIIRYLKILLQQSLQTFPVKIPLPYCIHFVPRTLKNESTRVELSGCLQMSVPVLILVDCVIDLKIYNAVVNDDATKQQYHWLKEEK